jgi:hypothetical protein
MEIYIKVETENAGTSWYVNEKDSSTGSYLAAGEELEAVNSYGYEYMRGSAAKSWSEAKSWAKDARMLANADGMGKTKVTFWKWQQGKLVQVKAPSLKAKFC